LKQTNILNKSPTTNLSPQNINDNLINNTPNTAVKKSIVKERQEMIVKNKDFLLSLYKSYVQTQDETEKELDLYQIFVRKMRK